MQFFIKSFQNNFKFQLKMFFFDGVLYFVNIFIYFENDSLLFLFDIFDMFQKQFRVLQPPCHVSNSQPLKYVTHCL